MAVQAATTAAAAAAWLWRRGVGGQGAQGVIVLTWTPIFTGSLVVIEASDTTSFTGKVDTGGRLAATEASDVTSFTGKVDTAAALTVTEGPDVASFTGKVDTGAALAATEGPDVTSFTGVVAYPAITATLAATEASDIVSFTGTVAAALPPITGYMAATEDQIYELLLHFDGADALTVMADSGGARMWLRRTAPRNSTPRPSSTANRCNCRPTPTTSRSIPGTSLRHRRLLCRLPGSHGDGNAAQHL